MKMERICKILLVLIVGFFISLSPITSSYLKADTVQDIKEITELYKEGLLTKEEFSKAKAKILGIDNKEKIQNYIQEVIKSDLQEEGQEDVFRKIKADFQAASISMEDKEIRSAMETSLQNAKEDFKK